MRGDATLFTRNDEVEAQWRICEPVLAAWREQQDEVPIYAAGSQGPEQADELLREGDSWRAI
jgi:glucose-6-phosphate 1-dehydrogenase